ncbi:MAG: hypothetical protein NHB14_07445 [Desulfosporosinus sp.]|nr:hypothetical protein [Desulfosporosinus sp.]
MSSTFGGLNILSRSLYANQASLETVGHNISNAGTDGYSRQRVNLVTASPSGRFMVEIKTIQEAESLWPPLPGRGTGLQINNCGRNHPPLATVKQAVLP